ncbi:MAG: tetratricopeptide repeat protein [Desulfuromonadaceae bacterium]|nr:tetratricopeptide repeat protein [Desulfuromonadaceae bacterium]MDD5104088.1 tetratricopeptide repeat protein [Desulfuromonadaceae bacterium]
MSLLADLLSKYKAGSPSRSSGKPGGLGIPPTLFKAYRIPEKVRTLDKRYVILTVASLSFVVLGFFVSAKFKLLSPPPKTIAPLPLPPRTVQKAPATPEPAPVQPLISLSPPPLVPANTARITLAEPNESAPQKKKRHPKEKNRHRPVQQAKQAPSQTTASPQKAAPLPAIDTAARDSLLYAARTAELSGDWRTALLNYRKAQKIDPGNYIIMNNAAASLNNLGMFSDGAQEAERSLATKPDYVPALINAAIAYSSKGNTRKAVRLFTAASAYDPGNRSLVINLGILHERNGDLDAALATYRKPADDGDPLALQGLARVYERKGNRLEAARACRQIMALPGAHPELKKEAKRRLIKLDE